MKNIKITITLLFCSVFTLTAFAQLPSSGQTTVLDGVYQQTHIPTKRVVSYAHLREADVLWSKRVWRRIETRERLNFPLFYPKDPISDRMSLFDVIRYAVFEEGSLTVYRPIGADSSPGDLTGDQFTNPILPPNGNRSDSTYIYELERLFGYEETSVKLDENDDPVFDPITGLDVEETTVVSYRSPDIVAWEVKEDWFFDRQKSQMDVRIIAISPVVYKSVDGVIQGEENLFWLYFPECRYVFQNFFVYNTENNAMRMSFDDLFWKRKFSSFITKEDNVYDRFVTDTEKGIARLLMAEKIKEEMFKIEHDLWHY